MKGEGLTTCLEDHPIPPQPIPSHPPRIHLPRPSSTKLTQPSASSCLEVGHVGGGVDNPQRAVDLERICKGAALKALRQHKLEDVAALHEKREQHREEGGLKWQAGR